MTARVVADDVAGVGEAIEVLRRGGVIALPTDTVYGIAVALETPGGIERLFHVKQRPPEKGIILLIDDAAQVASIGVATPASEALATTLWPGGLTLIVARRLDVPLPDVLTGGAATIGLRVPDHVTPRALAKTLGPLPTTSANRSGFPEARDASEILEQLGDGIDLILNGGQARGGTPSTVVDVSGEQPRILRAGAVSTERIAATLAAIGIELASLDA